jgi:hypothetical protein
MSVTPPEPVIPSSFPAWESRLVKFLLVAVPTILAIWQPNRTFNTPQTQAAIIAAGVIAAAIVHLVDVISTNGITKAGLQKTVSEEVAWVESNFGTIKSAAGVLATLPGLPNRLGGIETTVAQVKNDVSKAVGTANDAIAAATSTPPPPPAAPLEVDIADLADKVAPLIRQLLFAPPATSPAGAQLPPGASSAT